MSYKAEIGAANARVSEAVNMLNDTYYDLDNDQLINPEKLEQLSELIGFLEEIEYRLESLAPSNEQ